VLGVDDVRLDVTRTKAMHVPCQGSGKVNVVRWYTVNVENKVYEIGN